ncbi:MAG: LysR family transcriptional regulator [Pseudomonadota bacterium]
MSELLSKSVVMNALPHFEAAARMNSFTKAADYMGMSQPSVSRYVAALEQTLNIDLFVRENNRVTLTNEGKILYQAVSDGLAGITRAFDVIGGKQTISIGCSHAIATLWLYPRAGKLESFFPNTNFVVRSEDRAENIDIDDCDVSILFGNGIWKEKYAYQLFPEEVFPVCSPALAEQLKIWSRPLEVERFNTLPLLSEGALYADYVGWADWFSFFGSKYNSAHQERRIFTHVNNIEHAMAGRGIILAWNGLVDRYLENNWLIELEGFRMKTNNGFYAVLPNHSQYRDCIGKLIDDLG